MLVLFNFFNTSISFYITQVITEWIFHVSKNNVHTAKSYPEIKSQNPPNVTF